MSLQDRSLVPGSLGMLGTKDHTACTPRLFNSTALDNGLVCSPANSLHAHVDQVVVEGGWRNKIATPVLEALGIPIMRTWNQTVPLHFLHHHYNPKW